MSTRAGASARDADLGNRIQTMLDENSGPFAISELVLMEFRNNLSTTVRDGRPQMSQYDLIWARESLGDVMAMITAEDLIVVPHPAAAAAHACTLVDIATEDYGIAFRVWDAVHLITCLKWGKDLGDRVALATTDDDFGRFIDHFPHFKTRIEVDHLVHSPD